MRFNDSSNKELSLYHHTLSILGLSESDTTTLPVDPTYTRLFNIGYRKAVFLIWKHSNIWEFDDSNYSTLPIAYSTIVDEQQDYSIPTNALSVEGVSILDSNGDYRPLKQIDKTEVVADMSEHYETPGKPREYDIIGNSVMLYPKPSTDDVTATRGLKLYLHRDIDAMTTSDTTQEPGILSAFHPIIAYYIALEFAIAKNITNKIGIIKEGIKEYEEFIKNYYSQRNRDFKQGFKPKKERLV